MRRRELGLPLQISKEAGSGRIDFAIDMLKEELHLFEALFARRETTLLRKRSAKRVESGFSRKADLQKYQMFVCLLFLACKCINSN